MNLDAAILFCPSLEPVAPPDPLLIHLFQPNAAAISSVPPIPLKKSDPDSGQAGNDAYRKAKTRALHETLSLDPADFRLAAERTESALADSLLIQLIQRKTLEISTIPPIPRKKNLADSPESAPLNGRTTPSISGGIFALADLQHDIQVRRPKLQHNLRALQFPLPNFLRGRKCPFEIERSVRGSSPAVVGGKELKGVTILDQHLHIRQHQEKPYCPEKYHRLGSAQGLLKDLICALRV